MCKYFCSGTFKNKRYLEGEYEKKNGKSDKCTGFIYHKGDKYSITDWIDLQIKVTRI